MTTPTSDRLGQGWAFPPSAAGTGGVELRAGAALVRQSILLIMDTEPGERIMRPDFGCGLRRYLMEPNTPATRAAIAREVDGALRAWEPRIDLSRVEVDPTDDPSTLVITVVYVHVRDRSQDGLQVPLTLAGGPAR